MITYENQLAFFIIYLNNMKKLNDFYCNAKCVNAQQKGMVFINVCYYQNLSILDVYDVMHIN